MSCTRCRRAHLALLGVALVTAAQQRAIVPQAYAGKRPPPAPVERPVHQHLEPAGAIPLPGRGQSLAWAPDGRRLAVGGHFREKTTRLRYDTRIADVASRSLVKSFACHWYWAVAQAWVDHPVYGELLADGGADHTVKIWNPLGRGSSRCNPGQFLAADGALEKLGNIDGWIVSLAFSPDRRWLAGASRDRTVRIWQAHPGRAAWKVVGLWFDAAAGNFLSVDWAPSGRGIVTGDRRGRVAVWDIDPERERWDDAVVAQFASLSYAAHPAWFRANRATTTRTPRWSDPGRGVVWNARWSPDGERVAAGGADGAVTVYAADSGRVLLRWDLPVGGSVHGLAWHPGGRWLAAGGSDARLYVYDTRDGVPHDVLVGHADVVTAVAWSPRGDLLASTAGGPLLQYSLVGISEGPDQAVRLWRWR